jgi:muramoyltetrapeptide carboxypeptidase
MIAPLLQKGDTVRVITPARSLALPWMSADLKRLAQERLEALGLTVTFGKYVNECDAFSSTTVERRIEDLHDAFANPSVKLILSVIGGYNSNQLLQYIDYDLIRKNPKRLCGFSDITALGNAIYAKSGLVTYSGPHFFNFGQKKGFDYTQEAFVHCHFSDQPYSVTPSTQYVDGYWANNQDNPEFIPNKGWLVLNEGEAEGTIIGGNLGTFGLLFGTDYMPRPEGDIILFIEEDSEDKDVGFDRHLQALLHQSWVPQVRAIVIGRYEKASGTTNEKLTTMIRSKKELRDLPIIANVDFGHTTPLITFPIGGRARIKVSAQSSIEVTAH